MTLSDIKLFSFNTAALTLSMANIDLVLKVLLLVISIGYTIQKWWVFNKKNK